MCLSWDWNPARSHPLNHHWLFLWHFFSHFFSFCTKAFPGLINLKVVERPFRASVPKDSLPSCWETEQSLSACRVAIFRCTQLPLSPMGEGVFTWSNSFSPFLQHILHARIYRKCIPKYLRVSCSPHGPRPQPERLFSVGGQGVPIWEPFLPIVLHFVSITVILHPIIMMQMVMISKCRSATNY